MNRRLPPLVAIRAFEAFSRFGSVRKCAEELAVSHTVISRHIQNLETAVGAKLVRKSGRGLELTREGQRYATQLRRAFDIIADASGDLKQGEDALHVCCMAGLASRRLLARLSELEEALAGRELTLEPTSTRPDFNRNEADAEIVYLEELNLGDELCAELFVRPLIRAVASPAFCNRYDDIQSADDLVHLPLIHERNTQRWSQWLSMAGVTDVPRLRGPRLWHGHLTLEAACMGQGVALVSELLADEKIASGDLVDVLPVPIRLGGYYFIAPTRKWNDQAIVRLRQWLHTVFASTLRNGA
ncbi:LysR substrate-binding domain-containing protein [Pseudomonas mangiferae]|uniref:LysR family transcriptional regulator n=1 Tax=Pseudomonas mangiferae TaxID=2593654 RepID=A0A553H473_9PSED|nr:LysR family transcriptional regulator [Pseudomonas mangiferae]TRX76537.1 LysR family transcriptional regulator [Pseudomonas mangiferae]